MPYNLSPSTWGMFYMLGILGVDLTFDLHENLEARAYYYMVQRTAKPPTLFVIPFGIILAFIPVNLSLARDIKNLKNLITAAIGGAMLVGFVTQVIPKQDFLANVMKEGSLNKNRAAAMEALDVIRIGHLALAVGFIIGAFLQQLAAKVKEEGDNNKKND